MPYGTFITFQVGIYLKEIHIFINKQDKYCLFFNKVCWCFHFPLHSGISNDPGENLQLTKQVSNTWVRKVLPFDVYKCWMCILCTSLHVVMDDMTDIVAR